MISLKRTMKTEKVYTILSLYFDTNRSAHWPTVEPGPFDHHLTFLLPTHHMIRLQSLGSDSSVSRWHNFTDNSSTVL